MALRGLASAGVLKPVVALESIDDRVERETLGDREHLAEIVRESITRRRRAWLREPAVADVHEAMVQFDDQLDERRVDGSAASGELTTDRLDAGGATGTDAARGPEDDVGDGGGKLAAEEEMAVAQGVGVEARLAPEVRGGSEQGGRRNRRRGDAGLHEQRGRLVL